MNKQINWILPFTSIMYGFIIQHLKNQCLSIYHLFYKPMFMYLNVCHSEEQTKEIVNAKMFLTRLCNLFLDISYNSSPMKKRHVCETSIVTLVWCGEKFIFWLNTKCSKVIVTANNTVKTSFYFINTSQQFGVCWFYLK